MFVSVYSTKAFSVSAEVCGEVGTQDNASNYNIINQECSYAMYYTLYLLQ